MKVRTLLSFDCRCGLCAGMTILFINQTLNLSIQTTDPGIGVDFEYDPLYAQYLQQQKTRQLRKLHLVTAPMLPENMPYYRGLQIQPPADAAAVEALHALHVQTLLTATVTPVSVSPNTLCIMPIRFGSSSNAAVYQALHLPV